MRFHIITIFPKIFNSYFSESIIKRAQTQGKIKIKIYNLRDWAKDKHKTVDDAPYGGGAGMIMKIDVLYGALRDIKSKIQTASHADGHPKFKTVLTSAKGKIWNQQKVNNYSKLNDMVIICGRYEGVDERIMNFIDEEISVGDYVLTGGEIPAMAMVDSIARLIPGVLGNAKSLNEESFSTKNFHQIPQSAIRDPQLEYPQYTRPEIFIDDNGKKHKIPDILLSGHHAKIKKWREQQIKKK